MRGLLVAMVLVMLAGCGTMRLDFNGLGNPMGTGLSIEVVSQDGEVLVDQDFMVKLNRIYDKLMGYVGKVFKKGGELTLEPDIEA